MALTVLLTILLCSSCLSEQKPMDPDVKEEKKAGFGSSFSTAPTAVPFLYEHLSSTGKLVTQKPTAQSTLPFLTESLPQPARRGNWCAFVHERLVSVAQLSSDVIVKSVHPCTNDDADCQIYRQKQKTITALQWKCCPGHVGHDCKEKVTMSPTGESQSSEEHPETASPDGSQADDSDSGSGEAIPSSPPPPSSFSMPFMDSSSLLMFHQIFAAVMMQLQPVLDGFNHTLENLSREVKVLSMDLKNLRHEQEHISKIRHAKEKNEKDVEDNIKQMQQIWTDLDSQQKEIKHAIHLQGEHLLHNMTSLKDKFDHYINGSQKEIQVSVQSLNKSMEEIRLTHERLHETIQVKPTLSVNSSWSQVPLETSVWEAIGSLDMKVLNNTMELSPLIENSKHLINIAQKLDHGLRNLSERLEDVSLSTEVNLAQIGLEVEAARVATLKIVNELDLNLGNQQRDLRETQLDLDNIYQHLQNNELATAGEICSCKEINDSLVKLESEVANVTNFAKENRYALEDVEAKTGTSPWALELEDLHQGLWNVRESLTFEQVKRKAINDNVAQLKTSLQDSQKEINGLKEQFVAKQAEIGYLSASFNSLLEDAIRHSDVLEALVGDEIMEFSSWPDNQQNELAIPVLLQSMRMMQQKIDSHDNILSSLRKISKDNTQMANDDPMTFTEWIPTKDQGSHTEEHQDSLPDISKKEEEEEDYSVSDFWSLGREVEQLAHRLTVLEQQAWNCTAAPSGIVMELQKDVLTLQQTLDNLRTFQNLFRYTEELASSDGVNLDQLQSILRTREKKKKKGQNIRKKGDKQHPQTY